MPSIRPTTSPRALILLTAALALPACGPAPQPQDPVLLKKTEKLEAVKPAVKGTRKFEIADSGSKVVFEMDAPFEKIRGRLPASAYSGHFSIDPRYISRTTGLVVVDISELELFQRKADDDGNFGEETKSDTQNEHARDWLEIGEDAPADERKKNQRVEFSITSISKVDHENADELEGNKRTVKFTATGKFRLHQRVATKKVDMEAVFDYVGEDARAVSVRTLSDFDVDLAAHDVRPRTAFGQLAQKTLEAMAPKVAKVAQVSVQLRAIPAEAAKPAVAKK